MSWILVLSLKAANQRRVPRLYRFGSSAASAFLTLDWEIPNCRAILAGVKPALKAERMTLT
jgi:hypothetical protein